MDLTRQMDLYCERLDPGFWAEPLNAVTNLSFILAALFCWAMLGGKRDLGARVLTLILLAIGVGSFLFHTYATAWANIADVAPISAFILVYVYLATTRFLDLPRWAGLAAVAAYFPYSWAVTWAVRESVGSLNGSVAYAPVPLLILAYAAAVAFRDRDTARGLAIGAGLLVVSLVFRTIDNAVCPGLPIGTHFLWHTLNGVLLGWMIVVMHRSKAPETL